MNLTTERLAEFAATWPFDAVPEPVIRRVTARLAVTAGLAVMGCWDSPVDVALNVAHSLTEGPGVAMLGREDRLGLPDAPLALATSSLYAASRLGDAGSAGPFDAAVVAAVLTTGQATGAAGNEILAALALANEIATRLEQALAPELRASGWASGCVSSRLGAAAGAGRLLGLDAPHMVWAFGIAATQAAGFSAADGTTVGFLSRAKAASDGVEAAAMASLGFHGSALPIEGRRGLAAVLTPAVDDLTPLTDGLGEQWRVLDLSDMGDIRPHVTAPHTLAAVEHLATAPDLKALLEGSLVDAASA